MMLLHDRVTNSGDTLEEVLRKSLIRTIKRLNEINMIIRLLTSSIDALEAERHIDYI
jgi:hypothetical protein